MKQNIDKILRHISHVEENIGIIAQKKMESGEVDFAIKLIANGRQHDLSKITNPLEQRAFVYGDETVLKSAVCHHNGKNLHHPEAWGIVSADKPFRWVLPMEELYVAEMVADWKARSSEFGTDLREWIDKEATNRFNFELGGKFYVQIMSYVDMICDKPFERLT